MTRGTLLIDILDASGAKILWRGWVMGIVDDDSPDWVYSRIDESVKAVFAKLPVR